MQDKNSINTVSFDSLNEDTQNRIMMYRTARQFKNAVPIEEMLIIPSKLGEWVNYCDITLNNISLTDFIVKYGIKDNSTVKLNEQAMATARGNEIISKQTPFIVNKALACEIFLKLILLESNIDFKDLKGRNGHNLWELYSKSDYDFKKNLEVKMFSKGFSNITDEIKNISEAFIDWRYIYEKYEIIDSLNFLFLDELCSYLNEQAKRLILDHYNYDVNRDIL